MLEREYWVSASHCNVIVSRDENTMLVKKSTYKERLLDVGEYQGSKEYIRFDPCVNRVQPFEMESCIRIKKS